MSRKIVGQGPSTKLKEAVFASALFRSLKIANAEGVRRFAYYHLDMNAGPGWNEEVECPGSPRVFLELARLHRPNYYAFFVDRQFENISKLLDLELDPERDFLFPYDNAEMPGVLAEFIRSRERNFALAVGSILIDPNGYTGDGFPLDALASFCATFRRIDIIINLNLTTYHLARGNVEARRKGWISDHWPSPVEVQRLLSRPHGLVQKRVFRNAHHFLTLELRSIKTGEHKALGLYDVQSEQGRHLLGARVDQQPLPLR